MNPVHRQSSSIKEWFDQVSNHFQAARITRLFRPKIRVHFEKSGYRVKTIETKAELSEVMKLRFQVFHKEYRKTHIPFGIDVEPFDLIADHLVIQDIKTNKIIGTYRLISTLWSEKFYSQTEFEISDLLKLKGEKLEMSRACVHPDHRKGFVMHLLWRGLTDYMTKTSTRYLFGCSSVQTLNPLQIDKLVNHFSAKENLLTEVNVYPKHLNPSQIALLTVSDCSEDVTKLVPPLLNSYLKAGAKVASVPAYDFDFQCVDFFTVLDMNDLTAMYERRYAKC